MYHNQAKEPWNIYVCNHPYMVQFIFVYKSTITFDKSINWNESFGILSMIYFEGSSVHFLKL